MKTIDLLKKVSANGCSAKVIAIVNADNLPEITVIPNTVYARKIDLSALRNILSAMNADDVFVIGRSDGADYLLPSLTVYSRIHCAILKTGDLFQIMDCSVNGTAV